MFQQFPSEKRANGGSPLNSPEATKAHPVVGPQERLERVYDDVEHDLWGVNRDRMPPEEEVVGGFAALLQYLRSGDPPFPRWRRSKLHMIRTEIKMGCSVVRMGWLCSNTRTKATHH